MTIADDVKSWVKANWSPDLTLRQWWQRLADAGYSQPTWPQGLGGLGMRPNQAREVVAALAECEVIGPPTGIGPNMVGPTILDHGSDVQKQRWVSAIANGTESWVQLFSEPGAGSDIAGLSTKALVDGEELVVTGQKVWNSGAEHADFGMLIARTNVDKPKHFGISWMIIDMIQPGITVRPLIQMNGGSEFCEVFLDEARCPLENVVGGVDEGWNVTRTTLNHERTSIGQFMPKGLFNAAPGKKGGMLDMTCADIIARQKDAANNPRKRFDVMVGWKSMIRLAKDLGKNTDPVVRQEVAYYYSRTMVHSWSQSRAKDNAKAGRIGPEGSIGKLSNALLAHISRDISMSILGADGMLMGKGTYENGKISQACLGSHAPSLGGGTNEIQRNILGERILGLPREPNNDAEIPFKELRRS